MATCKCGADIPHDDYKPLVDYCPRCNKPMFCFSHDVPKALPVDKLGVASYCPDTYRACLQKKHRDSKRAKPTTQTDEEIKRLKEAIVIEVTNRLVDHFEERLAAIPQETADLLVDQFQMVAQDSIGVTHAPKQPDPIDIEIEVREASRDEDNIPTYNMLIASALNIYGDTSGLPQEAIDYGIRTGRLESPEHAGPRAMDVPEFDMPEIEDVEW